MLERVRLKLRILERLAHEFGPLVDEPLEPAGVGLLGRGLCLEPAPRLRRRQLLGRQLPELLVGGKQAHFAVTDLAGLLAELLQPGVEHERMFRAINHIEHQRRRHRAAATRHEVLGKGPDRDRLRSDPEGIGAERRHRVERLHIAAARLQDPLPLFERRGVTRSTARRKRIGEPLPFEAHATNPEVVAGCDLELQRVGLEKDASRLRHVEHHHHRRLVGPRGDQEFERRGRLETVGVAPGERDLRLAIDDPSRRVNLLAVGLHRLAIDSRPGEVAGGGGDDRHTASFHRRDHPAANVLPAAARPLEILGQHHLSFDAGEFRPMHGRKPYSLTGIASRHRERTVGHLRRQCEHIVIAVSPSRERGLAPDPQGRVVRPPAGVVAQCHAHLGRLAMRHHDPLWQLSDAGERESLNHRERGSQTSPGIGGRVGRRGGDRRPCGQRQAGGHGPGNEASGWRCVTKVDPPRLLGHLRHGGLAQGPRLRLPCGTRADDVDDAEQFVAHRGKPSLDQPRHLLQRPKPKAPATDRQRHRRAGSNCGEQNRQSHDCGRLAEPVAEKHRKERQRHAADRQAGRLEELDPADAATKRRQSAHEVGRQRDPAVRWHVSLRPTRMERGHAGDSSGSRLKTAAFIVPPRPRGIHAAGTAA